MGLRPVRKWPGAHGLRRPRFEQLEWRIALSADADSTWTTSIPLGPQSRPALPGGYAPAAIAAQLSDAVVQHAASAALADGHDHASHSSPIQAGDPTAPLIRLQHDEIPNFAQRPTNLTIASGAWSDPAIWSARRVPQQGDIVQISGGTLVEYDAISDASIRAIGIHPGATLRFRSNVDTRLTVGTLIVFEGGALQIGRPAAPIPPGVRAEVVFDGAWLGKKQDPSQYGVGLLGFGEVTVHGARMPRTWLRLAREARAGDFYLDLEGKVSGWWRGDTLFLPDTRQIPSHLAHEVDSGMAGAFDPQWEEVTIAGVIGNRVYLTAPLRYDHLGARNEWNEVEFLPHAAVLDRNVVLRSATPDGVRGHVLLGGRAEVDIRYARFKDLGRTDALAPLDSTTRDQFARVTRVGTNQIGRYSLHLHHLVGPENPTNQGYQFRLIGNTFDDGRKWGLAVHGSSFGLIQDNVVYKMQGGGFVTEDGSEIENLFYRNFAARVYGTNLESSDDIMAGDTGRSGAGIWMRRTGNFLVENVVANVSYAGVLINGGFSDHLPLPAFRGAIVSRPGESILLRQNPGGAVANLEVYGRTRRGVWLGSPAGGTDQSMDLVLSGLRIWHTDGSAIEAYRLRGLSIIDSVVLGSREAIGMSHRADRQTVGFELRAYETSDVRIADMRIAHQHVGIRAPEASSSRIASGVPAAPTRIENAELTNLVNVEVPTPKRFLALYPGKSLEIVDTLFRRVNTTAMLEPPDEQYDIVMQYASERLIPSRDLLSPDVVTVRNFNRTAGDDFRVYYLQQRADFVPPAASEGLGSPAPGLTNQQLWNQFGVALAGSIAPCQTTRAGIVGFACPTVPPDAPILAPPAAAPRNRGPVAAAVDAALGAKTNSASKASA